MLYIMSAFWLAASVTMRAGSDQAASESRPDGADALWRHALQPKDLRHIKAPLILPLSGWLEAAEHAHAQKWYQRLSTQVTVLSYVSSCNLKGSEDNTRSKTDTKWDPEIASEGSDRLLNSSMNWHARLSRAMQHHDRPMS